MGELPTWPYRLDSPREKRRLRKYALAVLVFVFPLQTCVDWVRPRPDHGAVRRFPHTELAKIDMGSDGHVAIAVSPDDRWLVFSEYAADFPELLEIDVADWYRLASIDLQSGVKRTHRAPPDLPTYFFMPHGMVSPDGAACWIDGVFVLDLHDKRSKSLVVNPAQDELELRPLDKAPMECSDCAPVQVSGTRAKARWSNFESRAWKSADGPVDYKCTGDAIVRIVPDSRDKTVISKLSKWRFGMVAQMDRLGVSPDGRYIAYSVLRDLVNVVPFIPGSGWTQYLYVRDLKSRRDRQLAVRSELSNLAWSSDSRKLYFSSKDVSGLIFTRVGGSVCVVDMADVFGR